MVSSLISLNILSFILRGIFFILPLALNDYFLSGALGVTTQSWGNKLIRETGEKIDDLGPGITAALFDQALNQKITFTDKKVKGRIEVKRAVFDNQDIYGTWTVIDKLGIGFEKNKSIPLLTYPLSSISLQLGIGGKIEVENYQTIASKDYKTYSSLEELANKAQKSIDGIEKSELYFDYDPSIRARIHQVYNPFLGFFKIPFNKKKYLLLRPNELLSYGVTGFVGMGLSVGLIPFKVADDYKLSALNLKLLKKGEYKISVLKESNRYARVKLTKIRRIEKEISTGSARQSFEIHEGLIIASGKGWKASTGKIKLSVVPFKFSSLRDSSHQQDIAYRFDLTNPEAEKAFFMALQGDFFPSENLSQEKNGVEYILTRKAKEVVVRNSGQIGFDLIFKKRINENHSDLEVVLEDQEGQKEIFKSSQEMTKNWQTIWGRKEKKNFLFTTLFNKTEFLEKKDNYMRLLFEGLIADNHTRTKEMRIYLDFIKLVLGNKELLPKLNEITDEISGKKNKHFSSSSFYFGQYFTHQQVHKFINTPQEEAWEICLKSFLYIPDPLLRDQQTKDFFQKWMNIKADYQMINHPEDVVLLLKNLRSLFNKHSKITYALVTFLMAIDGEEVDYFLSASNKTFGRIISRGKIVTDVESLLLKAHESFKFRGPIIQFSNDQNLLIETLKIKQISEEELEIKFKLPPNSRYLFFKIFRENTFRVKDTEEFVFFNRDRFQAGENTWIISNDTSDPLERAILDSLKKSDYHTLQISASTDKILWGRVSSKTFYYRQPKSK